MKPRSHFVTGVRLLAVCGLVALVSPLVRADAEFLAKARAFLGAETALQAVQGLRFTGDLEVIEDGKTMPGTAKVEIVFQKPSRQRISATGEGKTEITALDGYDAWQRVSDSSDPGHWQVTLLGPDQIKRLRANTFENLAFYAGIESVGGRVEDLGAATVDGVACRQFAFVYAPTIVFTRSFEASTGRLVLTETESGTAIREEGELHAGGLRFPRIITTTNKQGDGGVRVIRVTFSKVEVNPELDAAIFAMPAMTN